MEDKLKKFVRDNREAFGTKAPSAEVWNRIKSQIEPPKKERKISITWMWSAAAVILVLFTVGLLWQRNQNVVDVPSEGYIAQTDTTNEEEPTLSSLTEISVQAKAEIAAVVNIEAIPDRPKPKEQDEPTSVAPDEKMGDLTAKTTEMLAMLNDPHSAIKRLDAVLQAGELREVPTEIMEQLYMTVNHDPNSNVRMAALELLMAHTPMSEWDEKIQDVFVQQDDPVLQVELMHVMAAVDSISINTTTENKLHEITEDPLAIDFVKEQAYAVLMKNW